MPWSQGFYPKVRQILNPSASVKAGGIFRVELDMAWDGVERGEIYFGAELFLSTNGVVHLIVHIYDASWRHTT